MSETTPVKATAPAPVEKSPAKKKETKKVAGRAMAKCKASGPSVSNLITKAVIASKECNRLSLSVLKKALAAWGYDVDKNSRIKLGLKSLVSKGTLLQTKGTGTFGSFKLGKKVASREAKPKKAASREAKSKKAGIAKPRKPLKGSTHKKPKKATGAKKSVKKTLKKERKPAATDVKKVAKSPKKPKAATKPRKAAKSPAKPKAVKPKAPKPKAAKHKTAKSKSAKTKAAAPKKK